MFLTVMSAASTSGSKVSSAWTDSRISLVAPISVWPFSSEYSGCVAQFRQRLHVAPHVAELDSGGDLPEPVHHAVHAEQQGQGDRAHAGTAEHQHAERDRHQPGQD